MPKPEEKKQFDRHAGVGETSDGFYLSPNLVDMSKAGKNEVMLPDHLEKALQQVVAGDSTATRVFLAEALKPNLSTQRPMTVGQIQDGHHE